MATVYLAQDLRHHRQVAIKVLREDLGASIGPERFQREIEIAARLHHPHILPLYDSGVADRLLFYVMPYVAGESLRDRLAREGELPITDAIKILREVADALAKAHGVGVVHRDIKPDNIMLADRHALVADFGVAKAVSEATQAGGITTVGVALGTPAYMAPEQAAADPNTDHRADIYAFGVLAYEMLNGAPPFVGKTAQAVLAAHLTEAPAPVTQRRPSVPAPLAELVMRCLEKKAADRWQTADEIVTRLEAMGTPSGGMEPTRSMSASAAGPGRSTGRWLVAALVAVVVGVGGWLALRPSSGPGLDAGLVAVLPFRVNTTGADLSYLREGMVDLMATYLTGDRGTARSVEPASVIAEWQKRSGGTGADLAESEAASLARALGAGMLMSGSIVGEESKLVIRASLTEIGFRGKAFQASVEGPASEINGLLGQLVGQLLTLSAGMTVEESRGVLTNSLPALRAYLSGQAEYRRGAFPEAVNRFTEALQADSTFALAGLGLVASNGWTGTAAPEMFALAERSAWNGRERLGPKDRAVILAALGPNGTEPSTLRAELQVRVEATTVAPDRSIVWYMLGDAYMHDGLYLNEPNWVQRAESALRQSLARDSLEAGVIQHLILLAQLRNDTAEVERTYALFERATVGGEDRIPTDLQMAIYRADSSAVRAFLAQAGAGVQEPNQLIGAAYGIMAMPSGLPVLQRWADSLYPSAVASDGGTYIAMNAALMALDAGQPSVANRHLGRLEGNPAVFSILGALFGDGDSTTASAVAARFRSAGALTGNALCAVALWELARGDDSRVRSAVQELRGSGTPTAGGLSPTGGRRCAAVLEATMAQRDGDARAGAMINALDEMLGQGPDRGVTWENLALARLLENEREYARAARAASRYRVYYLYPYFLASHWYETARLSELAGDRQAAIENYSRFIELRRHSEPSLQPKLDGAKQALARLVGERN